MMMSLMKTIMLMIPMVDDEHYGNDVKDGYDNEI